MAPEEKDNLRLHHIVEACGHIADFIKDVTEEAFGFDYEKQSAVIRQFEIIGEAASKLTHQFTSRHSEIDWPKVVGMRHKMIHDYFDIDVKIVWTTANDDVPMLKNTVEKMLGQN